MPKYKNINNIQADLLEGKMTCVELLQYYLKQIENTQALNIYIEVFADEALAKATALDKKIKDHPTTLGKLFGAFVSIKDVICYKDHQVTAGSKILEGYHSPFSATAVEKLLEADTIIIGRVNCDEFAMGSTNETSIYGPTRNAANSDKIPGGSSGASAVAVQADTCIASIGSDTGGSVRQPAAFCGVVGMKPTYGRISRYGLLAYGSSFDQIGTLTHSVSDAAILLETMAGADNFDSTAIQGDVPSFSTLLKKESNRKYKIAYFDTAINKTVIDAEIYQQTIDFIKKMNQDGHEVNPVSFEYLDYIIPAYYVLTTAEASSNLARYDGVRYGYRSPDAKNLLETYQKTRTQGFGAEVKRRIILGTFVLSAGYYDAYYTKAQKVRRLIQQRTLEILDDFDFILMPASPIPAWNIGEKTDDPVAMYLADIYTVQANMVGIPAIAIPLGKHSNGTHIGIQLMAKHQAEASLMAFAAQYEQ